MTDDTYIEVRRRPSRGQFRGKDLNCFAVFCDGMKIGLIAEETFIHRWPDKRRKGVIKTSVSPRWTVIEPRLPTVLKVRTRKAAVNAVLNAHKSRKLAAELVRAMTGVTV